MQKVLFHTKDIMTWLKVVRCLILSSHLTKTKQISYFSLNSFTILALLLYLFSIFGEISSCLKKNAFLYMLLFSGQVSVRFWDSGRIHYSLRNHYNQLCCHPETLEGDRVPTKCPQWETHPGYCHHIWSVLAAVPRHQHGTGVWGRVLDKYLHQICSKFLLRELSFWVNTECVLFSTKGGSCLVPKELTHKRKVSN